VSVALLHGRSRLEQAVFAVCISMMHSARCCGWELLVAAHCMWQPPCGHAGHDPTMQDVSYSLAAAVSRPYSCCH
jgi:hypothetical protein